VRFRDLVVAPGREEHIARHHVTIGEAEEVVFGTPYIRRDRQGYLRVIGQTAAGRYVTVIVARRGDDVYTLVTPRDADEAERRLYRAHRRR
jgi:uncharacterized DUF497 family protein